MAYGDKGGASREGEVLAMLEAWPPDAMWCEAEESAQAPRVTRQQARLEAVEKLQDAWRRLKRDEKVPGARCLGRRRARPPQRF